MTITALPTPPSPSDSPAVFNAKAFDLLGALPTFVTEANGLEAENAAAASAAATAAANAVLASKLDTANPSYTGTLTGGTGVVNLGSGQFVKDASGNLGLGVTPSAWSGFTAFQLPNGGYFAGGGGYTNFTTNVYNDGSQKYINSGAYALSYQQHGDGAHKWYTAPSGTAGNPISFTQAMTLSAGADLLVGGQIYANGRGITKGFVTPDWRMYNAAVNALVWNNGSDRLWLTPVGNVTPGVDNTQTMGSASYRWSQVYAAIGTINTSDAREKTPVRSLFDDELQAAIALSKEIGVYQFLASVEAKGDKARHHIGMTVQRAIEIMKHHGLDPFSYGFICYDKWGEETKEHPAIEAREAVEAKAAVLDDEGNVIEPAVEAQPAIKAKDAWTEVTLKAGDRYSFRYDQLTLFIARGIDARLAALEAA